jgi:hypothetical protein
MESMTNIDSSLDLWADDFAVEELPSVRSASWLVFYTTIPFPGYTSVLAPQMVNQIILTA